MDPLTVIDLLLEHRPDKAKEILRRCCDDPVTLNEMQSCLLSSKAQFPILSPSHGSEAGYVPHARNSFSNSQHSDVPPISQKLTHRFSSDAKPFTPTPPRSTSSASQSGKGDTATGEDILLLIATEHGVTKKVVRMRTAPMKHSVIREDIVYRRGWGTNPTEPYEWHIPLPHNTDSGHCDKLLLSHSITLTWRRPNTNRSRETEFYVVPEHSIDTDVLLGKEDSGKHTYGHTQPFIPQGQRSGEHIVNGVDSNLRACVDDVSYHRSAEEASSSTETATQTRSLNPNRAAQQHKFANPVHLFPGTATKEQQQASPISAMDHNKATGKLRFSIKWDAATFRVFLDTNGPSEAFYEAFQKEVRKRRTVPNRAMITIIMMNAMDMNEDLAYYINMEEDSLDADWKEITQWAERHKRDEPPHLHGRVQLDDEEG